MDTISFPPLWRFSMSYTRLRNYAEIRHHKKVGEFIMIEEGAPHVLTTASVVI